MQLVHTDDQVNFLTAAERTLLCHNANYTNLWPFWAWHQDDLMARDDFRSSGEHLLVQVVIELAIHCFFHLQIIQSDWTRHSRRCKVLRTYYASRITKVYHGNTLCTARNAVIDPREVLSNLWWLTVFSMESYWACRISRPAFKSWNAELKASRLRLETFICLSSFLNFACNEVLVVQKLNLTLNSAKQ